MGYGTLGRAGRDSRRRFGRTRGNCELPGRVWRVCMELAELAGTLAARFPASPLDTAIDRAVVLGLDLRGYQWASHL